MGYKMKGSPHKMGTIQGTSGHASAVKQVEDLRTKEELKEANELIVARATLAKNTETARLNKIAREETAKKELKEADKKILKEYKKGGGKSKGLYITPDKEGKWAEGVTEDQKAAWETLSPGAQERAQSKNVSKISKREDIAKKEAKIADAKAKVDATRGTERGQVKKSGKLKNINQRQYETYKNMMFDDRKAMSFDDWKASDKNKTTKREERLTKEVGMTPEEYKANQATKAQSWQDEMSRAALHIKKDFDPVEVITFDEDVRTRDTRDETTKIDNEYKKLLTKTGAEAYKAKQKELSQDPNYTGDGTDINDGSTDK